MKAALSASVVFCVTVAVVAYHAHVWGHEIKLVSPQDLKAIEGNSGHEGCCEGPYRYQQIFPASEFESLPEDHRLLVSYAFRPDGSIRGPGSVTWDDLQIQMATTSIGYFEIAADFQDNLESQPTVVYDGSLTISTNNTGPSQGPKDFDQVVRLKKPFLYDPNQGSLLIDWTTNSGSSGPTGIDVFTSPVSMAFGWDPPVRSADFFWGGVVTEFTFVSEQTEVVLQAGDADQDLDFDQLDLVRVQIAAKYLTGRAATWGQGDWNGAPGGSQGNPPPGNGFFDQLDVIAALAPGHYLTGTYATVRPGGQPNDGQTSVGYNPSTGEVFVDAPGGTQLTSINIDSAAAMFTGQPALNLGGSFDNDADNNIFKATFGSSFGSLSFGNVAQAGLSEPFVLSDLSVVGSLAGGGNLGEVDLIYVPEPSPIVLAIVGLIILFTIAPQKRVVAICSQLRGPEDPAGISGSRRRAKALPGNNLPYYFVATY